MGLQVRWRVRDCCCFWPAATAATSVRDQAPGPTAAPTKATEDRRALPGRPETGTEAPPVAEAAAGLARGEAEAAAGPVAEETRVGPARGDLATPAGPAPGALAMGAGRVRAAQAARAGVEVAEAGRPAREEAPEAGEETAALATRRRGKTRCSWSFPIPVMKPAF